MPDILLDPVINNNKKPFVIIASAYAWEISRELRSMNFHDNKDFIRDRNHSIHTDYKNNIDSENYWLLGPYQFPKTRQILIWGTYLQSRKCLLYLESSGIPVKGLVTNEIDQCDKSYYGFPTLYSENVWETNPIIILDSRTP